MVSILSDVVQKKLGMNIFIKFSLYFHRKKSFTHKVCSKKKKRVLRDQGWEGRLKLLGVMVNEYNIFY